MLIQRTWLIKLRTRFRVGDIYVFRFRDLSIQRSRKSHHKFVNIYEPKHEGIGIYVTLKSLLTDFD